MNKEPENDKQAKELLELEKELDLNLFLEGQSKKNLQINKIIFLT